MKKCPHCEMPSTETLICKKCEKLPKCIRCTVILDKRKDRKGNFIFKTREARNSICTSCINVDYKVLKTECIVCEDKLPMDFYRFIKQGNFCMKCCGVASFNITPYAKKLRRLHR